MIVVVVVGRGRSRGRGRGRGPWAVGMMITVASIDLSSRAKTPSVYAASVRTGPMADGRNKRLHSVIAR